jgi:hypothetical protein
MDFNFKKMVLRFASEWSDTNDFTIFNVEFLDIIDRLLKRRMIGENNSFLGMVFKIFAFDEMNEKEAGKRDSEID